MTGRVTQWHKPWKDVKWKSQFNYFECGSILIDTIFEAQTSYLKIYYLISSPSVDDRLDKDAQVFPSLSWLVAFQAYSQACWACLIEGDLVHQLLSAVLQHQTPSIFTFLEDRIYTKHLKHFPQNVT